MKPLFNLMVGVYLLIPGGDLGVAIIVLTALIRLILFPLTFKTIHSQKALSVLNPKIKEIKERIKDTSAQSAAIMQLYKENNVNPLSGCLPLLIQLPVLIALYRTFLSISKSSGFDLLYGFISRPESIQTVAFGFLNLTSRSVLLAILAGVFQFIQAKISASLQKGFAVEGQQRQISMLNTQMLYFFPIMIIIISWNLPAGLTLYWASATLFSIFEQLYIRRRLEHMA